MLSLELQQPYIALNILLLSILCHLPKNINPGQLKIALGFLFLAQDSGLRSPEPQVYRDTRIAH